MICKNKTTCVDYKFKVHMSDTFKGSVDTI